MRINARGELIVGDAALNGGSSEVSASACLAMTCTACEPWERTLSRQAKMAGCVEGREATRSLYSRLCLCRGGGRGAARRVKFVEASLYVDEAAQRRVAIEYEGPHKGPRARAAAVGAAIKAASGRLARR